ncbi:MAG: phosphodiesterase [Ruminococcaceae bacterium]|nr:phosphodiesterase [Oscillospiraceae bacterium]
MKLLIASDIHGSAEYCRSLMEAIKRENPSKVLLLGDLLYHGPRNDLPAGYAPKEVAAMLNEIKGKLICVRGNCDTEVDQMMLDFPVLSDSAMLFIDGMTIYAAHGHHEFPTLEEGNVVISGHTHVPVDYVKDGIRYINPGSVSIPKENSWHGYVVLEDGNFTWKSLDGTVQKIDN